MHRALIIGHGGQDGRLLWDQLAERGDALVGIARNGVRTHGMDWGAPVDVRDPRQVRELVATVLPDQVYYLAAHHHSSQDAGIHDTDIWQHSWDVHLHGFQHVLEALREHRPGSRVFYASSSRIFGNATSSPQDETTPWLPDDSYGVTKAAGMLLAAHYRRVHGLFVACGILFNHESPLRGPQFVTRRIADGLVAVRNGTVRSLEVGSLDARVDWGHAPDYTRAMRRMLEVDVPADYIVATGETHSVREFIEIAASHLGLRWTDCVVEAGHLLRRNSQPLQGDARRLREATGWAPSIGFRDMVVQLVDAAIARHPGAVS